MPDYYCAKCNGRSSMYGHFTRLCKVTKGIVDKHHFCCPDNCELEAKKTSLEKQYEVAKRRLNQIPEAYR